MGRDIFPSFYTGIFKPTRQAQARQIRARICKRLRSPGIDSVSLHVAWRANTSNMVDVPDRQTGNRFLGFLKAWVLALKKKYATLFHSGKRKTILFFIILIKNGSAAHSLQKKVLRSIQSNLNNSDNPTNSQQNCSLNKKKSQLHLLFMKVNQHAANSLCFKLSAKN
jgi:hypothetical protein